jgi:undecaprenyl-diphosphatase
VTVEDVTQHNGLSTTDPSHLRAFTDHRTSALVDAAKAITELGAAPVLATLAVVAAAALWWRGERIIVALAPGIALAFAATLASVTKQAVGRARPPLSVRLVSETEPSFPSGHATDSAALYIALALVVAVFVLRRPLARLAVTVASVLATTAIGLSRLELGVHWPTDVLAGWAVGAATALVVILSVTALSRTTPPTAHVSSRRARIVALLNVRRSLGSHPSVATSATAER